MKIDHSSRDHLTARARIGFLAAIGLSYFPPLAVADSHAIPRAAPVEAKLTVARKLPSSIDPEMVMEGRKLFHHQANCFHCHGQDGAGTFFGPSLNDNRRINLSTASYEEINRLIHTGVPRPKHHIGAMPPMGGAILNEKQISALAAYVFTLDRGP